MSKVAREVEERFNQIAKPHLTGEKQEVIMELLKEFNPQNVEGMGIIITGKPIKGEVRKVIVSHFDLVRPFEKGFEVGKTITFNEDGSIYGALDNTITNAVLINELLDNGLPENTMILFTDGEESGMWGMRKFIKTSREAGMFERMFFINLDVTNDNWENLTSVEYDYPNKGISEQVDANIKAGFTTQRFADDMSPIVYGGGDGFSYCIPTDEYCHTYHSNTTVEHLEEYVSGLTYLIQELNVQEKERDGSTYIMGRVC